MTGLLAWLRQLAAIGLVLLGIELYQTRGHLRGEAPHAMLRTLDGDFVRLSSWVGQRTLIAVWAPWCSVCKFETGNIRRVRAWLEPSVRVVSVVASYKSTAEVRDYMRYQGVDYPVLLADDAFAPTFGVHGFPSFFVLDADGRIVGSMHGYTTTLGLWLRAKFAGALSR